MIDKGKRQKQSLMMAQLSQNTSLLLESRREVIRESKADIKSKEQTWYGRAIYIY